MPWTIIGGHDEAERFADALAGQPIVSEATTSISPGLLRAEDLFAHSQLVSERRVIDVSGDGPNNSGPPIAPVRDMLVTSGVAINWGMIEARWPISTSGPSISCPPFVTTMLPM